MRTIENLTRQELIQECNDRDILLKKYVGQVIKLEKLLEIEWRNDESLTHKHRQQKDT